MALALSLHLLVLAIFSITTPWTRIPNSPDTKFASHHAFEVSLVPQRRDVPVSVEKKTSTEAKQVVTDEVVASIEKEKTEAVQPHLQEVEGNKRNAGVADTNIVQEKNAVRGHDKQDADSKVDKLPIPEIADDRQNNDDWKDIVKTKIVANTAYVPSSYDGEVNAAIEFDVKLQPDGSVLAVEKLKASSNEKFDDAILQAVNETQSFSSTDSAAVPSHFTIVIHMIDLVAWRIHKRQQQTEEASDNG
jgi:outer membrane biosynthesis protein TonB